MAINVDLGTLKRENEKIRTQKDNLSKTLKDLKDKISTVGQFIDLGADRVISAYNAEIEEVEKIIPQLNTMCDELDEYISRSSTSVVDAYNTLSEIIRKIGLLAGMSEEETNNLMRVYSFEGFSTPGPYGTRYEYKDGKFYLTSTDANGNKVYNEVSYESLPEGVKNNLESYSSTNSQPTTETQLTPKDNEEGWSYSSGTGRTGGTYKYENGQWTYTSNSWESHGHKVQGSTSVVDFDNLPADVRVKYSSDTSSASSMETSDRIYYDTNGDSKIDAFQSKTTKEVINVNNNRWGGAEWPLPADDIASWNKSQGGNN